MLGASLRGSVVVCRGGCSVRVLDGEIKGRLIICRTNYV